MVPISVHKVETDRRIDIVCGKIIYSVNTPCENIKRALIFDSGKFIQQQCELQKKRRINSLYVES